MKLNHIGDSLLDRLIGQYGLPLHIIFTERINENATAFRTVVEQCYPKTLLSFAVKANPCRGAVRTVARMGLGVDVVSEYELRAALEEGIPPSRIVCNGNAKSDGYIRDAVNTGAIIAADSEEELHLINDFAGEADRPVSVLLRFTGMPLEGLTVADQSTASKWTKFGVPVWRADDVLDIVARLTNVGSVGLSAHIGTQICDPTGYDRLWEQLSLLTRMMIDKNLPVDYIDIGGGFPVSYTDRDDWEQFQRRLRHQLSGRLSTDQWVTWDNLPMGYGYLKTGDVSNSDHWYGKAYWSKYPGAEMLRRFLTHKNDDGLTVTDQLHQMGRPTLIVEPGRSLFGTAGITVAEVMGVKEIMGNWVAMLDIGIVNHGTNLVTPDIFPFDVLPKRQNDQPIEAFIAGRLCFTGDMISKVKVKLNRRPQRGDMMIIHHTGAYSADHFASNSCGFPKPAKIAVMEDGSIEVWRKQERFEDIFA